jgi:hypothetical protein
VDVLMLISAAVLISYCLALIIYSILAQYSEPHYIHALAVTAFGFCIGIFCASADMRRIIGKASLPLVIGGLAGLLAFCLFYRFFDVLTMFYNSNGLITLAPGLRPYNGETICQGEQGVR